MAAGAGVLALVTGMTAGPSAPYRSFNHGHARSRSSLISAAAWTGSTSSSVNVPDVPVAVLYNGYADLTRMTEWSPLLESVTVDADEPSHSVWVMRVPSALQKAAHMLGYPAVKLSWEADLVAPGPPCMNWTSTLDADGKLKGLPNAGFEPAGAVVVEEVSPGISQITLTLKYTLPDGVPSWQIALVRSPPVQFVLRSRISAGLQRFSAAMQREWSSSQTASATSMDARKMLQER